MRLLTIDQFADECGVNKETIRYHITKGAIKATGKYPTVIDASNYANFIEFTLNKAKLSK